MRWVLVVTFNLVAVSGCYKPTTERACEVACVMNGPCPEGLVCGAGNLCRLADGTCGDDPRDDANVTDGPPGTACYGAQDGLIRPCIPPPTAPLSLTAPTTIDTDSDPGCVIVDDTCVLSGTEVTIGGVGVVSVVGARPLVLVATETLTITASLDASSRRAQINPPRPAQLGAGANFAGCAPSAPPEGLSGSGGAGGSFQTSGSAGGASAGAQSGDPAPISPLTLVRGGCAGGRGSDKGATGRGVGGAGGGALYLISLVSITVDARLEANGEGGEGGPVQSGGGGGGSGGLIGLDAPIVVLGANGRIFANGGGGGEGGDMGAEGLSGAESTDFDIAAAGGNTISGGAGGNGGNGATGTAMSTVGGSVAATFGGGGGGGGLGYLFVVSSSMLTGGVSPGPTVPEP